jgi:hypothetical protein
MCVDCVLTSSRIAQVDPGDGPPSEVVLSHSYRSTNSSVGVNPHGSAEKVKLLLNNSHLEPQAVKPPCHNGDDDSE